MTVDLTVNELCEIWRALDTKYWELRRVAADKVRENRNHPELTGRIERVEETMAKVNEAWEAAERKVKA
jgi:hypothetical protein